MDTSVAAKQPEKHTNEELFEQQMKLLKGFLERGAISQAQFERSATVLTEKIPHGK